MDAGDNYRSLYWKFQHKGERKALEEGEGECKGWRGDFKFCI